MTEPKRLQLTTVSSEKKDDVPKKEQISVRFDLSLTESTDETCPEFSYAELMKKYFKKEKNISSDTHNGTGDGPPNPFGDEDDMDEVAAIAKQFEEKYGPKPGKKKNKHLVDVAYLGEGYDESDDFIDNSEAFDEVVPTSLTTKLGGFYINSGKLEFKEVSDDSVEDFGDSPIKKKKKIRVIDSDDENSSDKKKKLVKKRKMKDGLDGDEKKKKKKKLLNGEADRSFKKPKKPDKEKILKKKKLSPTVSELLKQQSESTSNGNVHLNGNVISDGDSPSTQDSESSNEGGPQSNINADSVSMASIGKEESNSKDATEDKKNLDPSAIPQLPANLPSELLNVMNSLKEAANKSDGGKCKFFTSDVNEMLLKVELHCRTLPCSQRQTIFGHLAFFLPCGKETLIKRAKKLRINQQDNQLKEPLQKLKEAVSEVMPELQAKYEEECQKALQQRLEKTEEQTQKEPKDESDESGDDEEKSTDTVGKKKPKGPRKKFEWNDKIRSLLCEVVKIKMSMCEFFKNKTQTAEEYLKAFLDGEVKPLWPKGWMQTRMLFKESRSVHSKWTSVAKSNKKTVIITKSNTPATTTPGTTSTAKASSDSIQDTPNRPKEYSNMSSKAGNIKDALESISANSQSLLGAVVAKSEIQTQGLDLLSSSAASAKPQPGERSWDHVVSDILKSSVTTTGAREVADTKMAASQENKLANAKLNETFLNNIRKYAAENLSKHGLDSLQVSVQQMKPNIQSGQGKISVTKPLVVTQGNSQHSYAKTSASPIYQQQVLQASSGSSQIQGAKKSASVQQTMQTKPSKVQTVTNQTSGSLGHSNIAKSLINEEVYRQLLMDSASKSASSHGGKTTPQQELKANSYHVSSGIPTSVSKKMTQSPTTLSMDQLKSMANTLSQDNMKISMGQGSKSSQISPTLSKSMYDCLQAQVKDMVRQQSVKSANKMTASLSTSSTSSSALLQSMYNQAMTQTQTNVSPQKKTSPVNSHSARGVESQGVNKVSPQGQPWGRSSLPFNVGSVPNSRSPVASSPYPKPSGVPKPVPGYQSVQLANFRTDKQQLPHADTQTFRGYTSLSPQQQQQQMNMLSGQRTSPQQQLQGVSGRGHSYPLSSPQQQASIPYNPYTTDQSRSSHGY